MGHIEAISASERAIANVPKIENSIPQTREAGPPLRRPAWNPLYRSHISNAIVSIDMMHPPSNRFPRCEQCNRQGENRQRSEVPLIRLSTPDFPDSAQRNHTFISIGPPILFITTSFCSGSDFVRLVRCERLGVDAILPISKIVSGDMIIAMPAAKEVRIGALAQIAVAAQTGARLRQFRCEYRQT
jgi:hypothetical protein